MMQHNEILDKKKILNILSVNFENVKKIDKTIASELEKRLAFAEDCVKILLSSDTSKEREDTSSLFDMLFDIEESNYDSFFVGENVIRENIFPCHYIFKCIDCAYRLIEYMQYHDEIQNRRVGISLFDSSDISDNFTFGIHGKKIADIKVALKGKLAFNRFTSYINLCDFQVLQLNYNSEENEAHLILDIQNKSYMFSVFIGVLKCHEAKFSDFKLY